MQIIVSILLSVAIIILSFAVIKDANWHIKKAKERYKELTGKDYE